MILYFVRHIEFVTVREMNKGGNIGHLDKGMSSGRPASARSFERQGGEVLVGIGANFVVYKGKGRNLRGSGLKQGVAHSDRDGFGFARFCVSHRGGGGSFVGVS